LHPQNLWQNQKRRLIRWRKALRRSNFKNVAEWRQAIEAFIAASGRKAKPFTWREREVKGSQLRNTFVNSGNEALA